MMAVVVHPTGGDFQFEPARMLFQTRPIPETWNLYDVSSRWTALPAQSASRVVQRAPITVGDDWTENSKSNAGVAGRAGARPQGLCHQYTGTGDRPAAS